MKFLAIFAVVFAAATAFPTSTVYNLQQLSAALQDPSTDPALLPHLEDALNHLMASIFAGENVDAILVQLPTETAVQPAPVLPELVPSPNPSPNPSDIPTLNSPLVQLIVNVAN